MKKMFSKMFQMSLFNHILRLAIVVLCLSYSVAALGGSQDYYSAVKVTITGGGKVYVKPEGSNSETQLTSTGVVAGKKTESWGLGGNDPGSSKDHKYTLRADASNTNYYFSAWKEGNEIKSQDPSYTFTIASTSHTNEKDAKNMPKEIQAIFNPYISISDKINFIVYSEGIDIVKFDIKDIYKRESLTLTLKGDHASKFLLGKTDSDINYSEITLGTAEGLSATSTTDCSIYLNYSDGEYDPENALAIGENTYLEITDNESHTWKVPIRTTAPETFTFLAGQGGKYTVVFANADKTTISNIISDQDPTYLRSDMYTLASLIATPNSGYKFFGWQTIDENGVGTYFSYDSQVLNKAFVGGTIIRPLFIPSNQATFIIKDDPNKTPYYDLQEALDVAKAKGYSTVVFNAPTKGTTGTLSPRSGGQPYVIPTGVTLLIPGDAAYTCRTKYSDDLPDSDFPSADASAFYSKLKLSDGTRITLQGGNLCVYSTISSKMAHNGRPISYGWIEMGEYCEIATTASQISYLYVLGYITGPESLSSSVQLNEGSIAYEAFQMPDFRGGSALSTKLLGGLDVANNDKGVFPSEQFYIQCIEVPMTIKSGATLRGMMPADISIIGIVKGEMDIVAQSSGMVQLTNNVELIKYYDSQRDVQVYQVIGKGVDQSSAKIGNVNVNIYGISMDTKNFVLPITSNMEIVMDGVTMSSNNRVGMLAGSKIWIKENAILNQNAQLYVYDKDENKLLPNPSGYSGDGYFGSENKELEIVKYTPNNSQKVGSNNKRTVANLTSAQLRVDGQLYIAKNGLYTTKSGADIVSYTDGALIKINESYASAAASETLYRLKQKSNEAVEYPKLAVNPAWLKNGNGTYVQTTGDAVAYQYYVTERDENGNPTNGIWSLPPATVTPNTWVLPEEWKVINPKTPVTKTITCQVENVTSANYTDAFVGLLNGTGFTFANGELANSISLEGNILSIFVKYTPQNNTKDAHTATLTLKNKQIQTDDFTYTTTLTATEEYIPEFSIDKSDITLQTLNNSVELDNAFTITPAANNVATLGATDGLVWSYNILNKEDDNENTLFGYTQGSLIDGTIENNTVTFTANTTGTQYARLVITATYTPTKGGAQSFDQTINLIGTKLIENTLAFDMPTDIWVTDKNIPVAFSGRNNDGSIVVTLTENGEDGSPIVELVETDGTYYINALCAGSFTMQASQVDNGGVAGTTKTYTINVNKLTPNPTWNWGMVYGNQTYSTPFDPATVLDGEWTLEESSDPTNALAYDEATHTIQVMNVGETTSAQFTFTQEETDIYTAFTQSYQVTINTDPRILTLVVDNKAKYDVVVADAHSDGVTCNEYGMITLPANGYVIVQFIGIPGDLTFQISEGAEYSAVGVAENTDIANAETWSEITKSLMEDKWQFAYASSSCVKLTNTSDTEITLTNLTITENSSYKRDTYYAKAIAVASPALAGEVAAKGNYLNTNLEYEKLFTSYSSFASTATAYSLAVSEMTLMSDQLAFSFQAQSNPGYYFLNWTPVGNPMIAGDLSWADIYHNYELYLPTTASDKSIAYSFDTYINLFCQQNQDICQAAKPDAGEPNSDAVAYRNAGALALIPATNVGTWQANFALAEVGDADDVVWDEVTSPNASDVAKHAVVFNILGDDKNDFLATIEEDKGFTFTEDDITLSAVNNTYTINASYTPQDVHGIHTAMLTLARVAVEGVTDESKNTITLTAIENLTPAFILADANFGSGTLGQETIIDILPTDKNTVAQLLNPSKLDWEASLSAGAPFEIISVADDGTCKVRYFRTASGNSSATLTLTATYTDSKGMPISCSKTCTLSGRSTADKADNTLALQQNIVLYVDDAAVSPFSVNDANNKAPITITLPNGCTALKVEDGNKIKPSGDFTTGEFIITVSQAGNDYFQPSETLTTTVTVKKHTPEVTWNLNQLYFGQTYDAPITTDSDGELDITAAGFAMVHYDPATKSIKVDALTEGEYNVTFTVKLSETNRFESFEQNYTALIYKDPRHLRVDVNSDAVYQAVTVADQTGTYVSYSANSIRFADVPGSESKSRQWTMYFIGVPDQLIFTPTGNNAWEIKESADGSSWITTYASAQIHAGKQFAMSLRPNTTHIRISYASNADHPSNGALSSFYITPLQGVKADVDGLFMPIAADPDNHPTTETVRLQYTAQEQLTVYTNDPQFVVNISTLPATTTGEYGDQVITLTSKATIEKEGRLFVKNQADENILELPIQTFTYPQELPVQLATDHANRFHYLATATNYVKWNANTRIITMQNTQPNTERSFTFAFDGAPSIMRFSHTAGERGVWTIYESANNVDWYEAIPDTRTDNTDEIEQGLLSTSRYIRVKYTSPYSEAVELSDLIIVGNASVTSDCNTLTFTDQQSTKTLTLTVINLADFTTSIDNPNFTVTTCDKSALTGLGIVDVPVTITWAANKAVDNATLSILNPNDNNAVLTTVELVGNKSAISDPTNIGIYTGLAEGITKINGNFQGTTRRPVDLTHAFTSEKKALFDYLIVYGETSTMDGSTSITTPTTQRGSNAKTPCYIYNRVGDTYQLMKVVDNVNSSDKAISGAISVPVLPEGVSTRVYITGFAPYASTGYTKEEEGVWLFRGQAGSKLDVYLEDCYIYSRYKTIDGHSFINRNNAEAFAENFARGSGGVLVFECSSVSNTTNPFDVTIHTCDSNLLKSHYGCFMNSVVGRAYQVSSPVQIHLISTDITATTHLTFDDIWPTNITRTTGEGGAVTQEQLTTTRTNGFLSLQKQVNNAPSIDLGSPQTVVTFNGGQVELENAQNVSDNYKTTLAISYRGGKFASFFLAHGMGSDEVSGTVNFKDGTTTVKPMTVTEKYRQYYLMDQDENGNQLNTTSCLRCPEKTYVSGGSHCMMRACQDPTSQGGAPKDEPGGKPLGLYKYPKNPEDGKKGGWTANGTNGLVTPTTGNVPDEYRVESVTPNNNGTDNAEDDYLNFWFDPSFEPSVQPEVDRTISYWKTCMTRISAVYSPTMSGSAGGDVEIKFSGDNQTELVMNFLYCKLDQNIFDVISTPGYKAPVKSPSAELGDYLEIPPSAVGDSMQHFVTNKQPYRVENRVYYITTATADMWTTFTAPFDVQNIYVAETYPEAELEKLARTQPAGVNPRSEVLKIQAKHNADFASFFAVTVAMGKEKTFEEIYNEYLQWALLQDKKAGLYTTGTYDLRGVYQLDPYMPGNWDANCYIYENKGKWTIDSENEEKFTTTWVPVDTTDHKIMEKGTTYSMLFPYCTGCEESLADRQYWDYWSGKYIIFESTESPEGGHFIDGSDVMSDIDDLDPYDYGAFGLNDGEAIIKGNTTLASIPTINDMLYTFTPAMKGSTFAPLTIGYKGGKPVPEYILPTESFMLLKYDAPAGMYIKGVRHSGEIIYGNRDNTTTGNGNMPTISGSSDMHITTTSTGINIAVATPQFVRVYTTNGSVIYAGMVNDNVNIPLNSTGIYMVAGENTVQKIMLNR